MTMKKMSIVSKNLMKKQKNKTIYKTLKNFK